MDLSRVLAELRRELQYIDSAIVYLERLEVKARRRGRPAKLRAHPQRQVQPNAETPRNGRLYGRRSES